MSPNDPPLAGGLSSEHDSRGKRSQRLEMYLTDDQLTHEHHIGAYHWALTGHEANDSYFRAEAADMHILVVTDAVSDLSTRAVQAGEAQVDGVRDHLMYGVARRSSDLRVALRDIIEVSPADRIHPLDLEEAQTVSRALNTIYINIRGTLDNLAYALVERHGGLEKLGLKPPQIDIFGKKFLANAAWRNLADELQAIAPWSAELARLRNPAAHQIPLAIVPAEMDEVDAAEYSRLLAEMFVPLPEGPLNNDAFERHRNRHQEIKRKISKLGRYRALFAHRPSDGLNSLYPTIPEDVGKMVRTARIVLRHLQI